VDGFFYTIISRGQTN